MASFFLPSYYQRRVLRYALSRLDILETDALDLDNLNIAWGKKSSVELRDIDLTLKVDTACSLFRVCFDRQVLESCKPC